MRVWRLVTYRRRTAIWAWHSDGPVFCELLPTLVLGTPSFSAGKKSPIAAYQSIGATQPQWRHRHAIALFEKEDSQRIWKSTTSGRWRGLKVCNRAIVAEGNWKLIRKSSGWLNSGLGLSLPGARMFAKHRSNAQDFSGASATPSTSIILQTLPRKRTKRCCQGAALKSIRRSICCARHWVHWASFTAGKRRSPDKRAEVGSNNSKGSVNIADSTARRWRTALIGLCRL